MVAVGDLAGAETPEDHRRHAGFRAPARAVAVPDLVMRDDDRLEGIGKFAKTREVAQRPVAEGTCQFPIGDIPVTRGMDVPAVLAREAVALAVGQDDTKFAL